MSSAARHKLIEFAHLLAPHNRYVITYDSFTVEYGLSGSMDTC